MLPLKAEAAIFIINYIEKIVSGNSILSFLKYVTLKLLSKINSYKVKFANRQRLLTDALSMARKYINLGFNLDGIQTLYFYI